MSDVPDPLIPAEVDLRDFPFMPLDVRRLRDSRLVATRAPEEVLAAILLWSASWHQQPASSLPDDDLELSQLAGYGRAVKEFKRIREGALHGLVLCSDRRWYHPVVAEKAAEAWNSRLEAEWRRACDRVRKENKDRKERGEQEVQLPSRPALLSMQHANGIPSWEYITSAGIPSERLRNSSLKGKGKETGILTEIRIPSSDSSAKASEPGGKPPKTAAEIEKLEIWRTGKDILIEQGMSRDGAGAFVGKLCVDYGNKLVLQAVPDCAAETPADAKSWLVARCQERRANPSRARTRAAVEEFSREGGPDATH